MYCLVIDNTFVQCRDTSLFVVWGYKCVVPPRQRPTMSYEINTFITLPDHSMSCSGATKVLERDNTVRTTMAFDNLKSKLDDAREGTGGSNDYEELPRVKLTPEVALGGTIVDVGFTGDVEDEQNIRGGSGYGGDFVFTLENPELITGTLFEALGREDAEGRLIKNIDSSYYPFNVDRYNGAPTRDFRAVPDDWEDSSHVGEMVKNLDGEYQPVGIEAYGTEFPGQPTTFEESLTDYDRIEVFIGGQAGRMMMTAIDTTLSRSAYYDDEDRLVPGLVEYPRDYGTNDWNPNDGSLYPRAIRSPVLHPELEGEEIALFLHFGDMDIEGDDEEDDSESDSDTTGTYRKQYGDVLWDDGNGGVILTQEDVLEPNFDLVSDVYTWMELHEPSNGFGSDGSGDGGSNTFSALEGAKDDDDGDDTELVMADLDADTREFVEQAADFAADKGGIDAAFEDFDGMVDEAVENGEIGEYDSTDIRPLVETEVAA